MILRACTKNRDGQQNVLSKLTKRIHMYYSSLRPGNSSWPVTIAYFVKVKDSLQIHNANVSHFS